MNKKSLRKKTWFKASLGMILLTTLFVPAYAVLNPTNIEAEPLQVGDKVEILTGYHEGQTVTITKVRLNSSGVTYVHVKGTSDYDGGVYQASEVKQADLTTEFAGIKDLLAFVEAIIETLTGRSSNGSN